MGVTVTLDMLSVVLFIASILYSFCFILAKRKLDALSRLSPSMSTKKLLILSAALVAVLRIMTILGVAIMNICNIRVHYSLKPVIQQQQQQNDNDDYYYSDDATAVVNHDQNFYDSAMMVLFDLPNCIVVSTYILLSLIWGECFLESRLHNESTAHWKQTLLVTQMIFNTALYGTQMCLYSVIFFSRSNTVIRTILYAASTGINFFSVVLVVIFYIYLNIRFSGFPFRSQQIQISLKRISSVMTLWSMTRILWGILALLVFVYNVELLQDTKTPLWSFFLLLVMFFICEILPILAMLDYSYLSMMGMDSSLNLMIQQEKQYQQQQLESLLSNGNNNTTVNNLMNNNNNQSQQYTNSNTNSNTTNDTNTNRERRDSVEILTQDSRNNNNNRTATTTKASSSTTRTVRWEDQTRQQQQQQHEII